VPQVVRVPGKGGGCLGAGECEARALAHTLP
jgi:hypothetical protein